MELRCELRKEAMLAECQVSPRVFRGAVERLSKFMEPFAELRTLAVQRLHTMDHVSGLLANLKRY